MNEIKIEVKNINVKRGDIWMVNIPQLKDEDTVKRSLQKGLRPFLVTSNPVCNDRSPVINGVILTSRMTKAKLPTHVELGAESGLRFDSVALCEQPISLDKFVDLQHKVGECSENKMRAIEYALKVQSQLIPPFSMKIIEDKVFVIRKTKELYEITQSADLFRMYRIALGELRAYCNDYLKDYTLYFDDITNNNIETACAI